MERKETLTLNRENNLGIEIANSPLKQQSLVKIKGTLTSQIRKREETSPYYYAFVKLKGHGADLPVIFKFKNTPIYEGFIKENTGKYVNYAQCYNRERGNKCKYEDTEHCGACLEKLKKEFKSLE
ncbi:3944_t:CDS:1, partial [Ambispora leptoticha]